MASIAMTLVPRSGFSAEVYVSFKGPSPFTDNDNTKVANAITEYLGFYQRYFTYKTINFSAPDRPAIRMEMNADWSLHVQFCSPITCVDVGGGCSKVDVAQTPDPQEWPRAVRKALATRCLDQNTPVVNKLRDNVPLGLHTHPPQLPLGELYMRITRDGSPPSIPDWLYVSHLLISGKTNNVISVPDSFKPTLTFGFNPRAIAEFARACPEQL